MKLPPIGIVGASGWMGSAIVRSLLQNRCNEVSRLTLSTRRATFPEKVDGNPDVLWTTDNQDLVMRSSIVILAVRPQQFPLITVRAQAQLVISIMAGVSVTAIHQFTGARRIVRSMPNTAIDVLRSYTPWFATPELSELDRKNVQAIFEGCGEADEVNNETDIDYLAGLSGSGPAFPALLADAMLCHAAARGLPQSIARKAVRSVLAGADQLIAANALPPKDWLDKFMSYEGTTAAALHAMCHHGFRHAVNAGLSAAESTAREMSRRSEMGC